MRPPSIRDAIHLLRAVIKQVWSEGQGLGLRYRDWLAIPVVRLLPHRLVYWVVARVVADFKQSQGGITPLREPIWRLLDFAEQRVSWAENIGPTGAPSDGSQET